MNTLPLQAAQLPAHNPQHACHVMLFDLIAYTQVDQCADNDGATVWLHK